LAAARDSDGKLLLGAGHICENLFDINFLETAGRGRLTKYKEGAFELTIRYHIAKKKIPTFGEDGKSQIPAKENGMKFEQFIFDPFEYVPTLAILEVAREEEFAALKVINFS
jgi:UDP-N-acetylglucosamine/UDP-N-acetylgalactosamine diphosphorylase